MVDKNSMFCKFESDAENNSLVSLRKMAYVGDVTALHFLPAEEKKGTSTHTSVSHKYLLSGVGGQLLCYSVSCGSLLLHQPLLDGARIHGIQARWIGSEGIGSTHLVAVHGDRQVKVCMLTVDESADVAGVADVARIADVVEVGPFVHWVLDVRLLKANEGSEGVCSYSRSSLLAVGLTNNSVEVWDWKGGSCRHRILSQERCLLYSLALHGDTLSSLRVAAGTIFQGGLVYAPFSGSSPSPDDTVPPSSPGDAVALTAVTSHSLPGHEGSIHRIVWSEDGRWIATCSDDRTVRVWEIGLANETLVTGVPTEVQKNKDESGKTNAAQIVSAKAIIYGHSARLWDCQVEPDRQLVMTASEDCSCRVWHFSGKRVATFPGHRGRGVWRVAYSASLRLMVSGGADAAIKLFHLDKLIPPGDPPGHLAAPPGPSDGHEALLVPPGCQLSTKKHCQAGGDSKSEYVRSVAVVTPKVLYVATNRGLLYRAVMPTQEQQGGEVENGRWDLLWQNPFGSAVMCMSLEGSCLFESPSPKEHDRKSSVWRRVAIGDVSGHVSLIAIQERESEDEEASSETGEGSAVRSGEGGKGRSCEGVEVEGIDDRVSSGGGDDGMELRTEIEAQWEPHDGRRVLGVFWVRGSNGKDVVTVDAEGDIRWWSLAESIPGNPQLKGRFRSPFKVRILSADLNISQAVMLCGDQKGNIMVFDCSRRTESDGEAPVMVCRGAHGNTAVQFARIVDLNTNKASTNQSARRFDTLRYVTAGRDAHIHTFESTDQQPSANQRLTADVASRSLTRMKTVHVPNITAIEILDSTPDGDQLVAGFQSEDFIVWSLVHQVELLRVPCGGWKRPQSLLVRHPGGVGSELELVFVFVKGGGVRVRRAGETQTSQGGQAAAPKSLHLCFHGRETTSACWVSAGYQHSQMTNSSSVLGTLVTASEDGSLLQLHYDRSAVLQRLSSVRKVGEHASGTSIRAVTMAERLDYCPSPSSAVSPSSSVVVSVGAKEVLMLWLVEVQSHHPHHHHHHQHDHPSSQEISEEVQESFESGGGGMCNLASGWGNLWNWMRESVIAKPPQNQSRTHSSGCGSDDFNCTFDARREEHTSHVRREDTRKIQDDDGSGGNGGGVAAESPAEVSIRELSSRARPANQGHRTWRQGVGAAEPMGSGESDQRYTAVRAFSVGSWEAGDLTVFVVVASADAELVMLAYQANLKRWYELATFQHHAAPVLALDLVIQRLDSEVSSDAEKSSSTESESPTLSRMFSSVTLFSGSTDANIAVWDLTILITDFHTFSQMRSQEAGFTNRKVLPSLVLPLSHQSGVNCLKVAATPPAFRADPTAQVYTLVSGGDDQAIHVAVLEIPKVSDSNGEDHLTLQPRPRLITSALSSLAHASAIRGVWTIGRVVVSVGIDQRLRVWVVSNPSDSNFKTAPMYQVQVSILEVAEPFGINVSYTQSGTLSILVVGRGLQVIECNIAPEILSPGS